MSAVVETKRPVGDASLDMSTHDDKKQHTRLGRKPIETEPKSKRTAQNRAAQRAYRERKERKMKDLEDKVSLLEDDKMRAEAQIELLKSELSRYRGHFNISDLKTLGRVEVKREPSDGVIPLTEFTVGFPWAKTHTAGSDLRSNASSNHLPDLTSGSSSSNPPLNENIISSQSNSSEYTIPTSELIGPHYMTTAPFKEELDPFCASLNQACGTNHKPVPKLDRISQSLCHENVDAPLALTNTESPFQTLFTPNMEMPGPFLDNSESTFNFSLNNSYANDPPMALFNDASFDVNLALRNLSNDPVEQNNFSGADSLKGLVNEESMYDPFVQVNADFNFNEFVKSNYSGSESSRHASEAEGFKPASSATSFSSPTIAEEDEADKVVPAPQQTMKCSELWHRITAHPRYTEIDIDGLCAELKAKAKCSEKGVVLNAKDVNALLEKSAKNKV